MIDNIILREVQKSDFEDIFNLLKQLWPNNQYDYNKTQEIFERNLKSDYKRLICATYDSRIIGFCSLTIKNNLWQQGYLGNVDELVIDESYRGKGVGTMLLDSIINKAKDIGCKKIELDSGLHRIQAHEFYKNLGFDIRAHLFSKSI